MALSAVNTLCGRTRRRLSGALSTPVIAQRRQSQSGKPGEAEFVVCDQTIENGQHWILDVQFGEDACRARKDHSAENLALIRRTALNLLRHNGPARDSLRQRKLRAALSDDYRGRLIRGIRDPDAAGST